MPWNWGKISDLDLELEVKRCYQSLLEAQETSENCARAHDDVGKTMEGKSTPGEHPGKLRFPKPEKRLPGKVVDEDRWVSKLFQSENPTSFGSPYTSIGSINPNSFTSKSAPHTLTTDVKFDMLCNLSSETLHDDRFLISDQLTSAEGTDGREGLFNAAKTGQIVKVQQLLLRDVPVNPVDRYGKSPLVYAVENGFTAIARELIEHGAYVNQRDKNKRTPLRIATEAGRKSLIDILLRNHASVYILDEKMKAPLHYAVEKNFPDIVELLLKFGAPPNQSDGNQKKPLHYAAERGYLLVVELLLSKGASVDCMDRDMRTALILAVEKGLEIMTHTLISRGASVNAADRRRRTALHVAAGNGLINIALELIANRAGVNSRDDGGKTPVYHAVKSRDVSMVNALIQHGAQMDIIDTAGKTILRYATETKSEAIIYLVAKAELDQCGVKRYIYERQLQTAIQEDCDFLGKTVWNHVMDHCTRISDDVREYQMMTATVHSLLENTCTAFSRKIHQVLIKLEPLLRNGQAESPYLSANVIALPAHRPLTFMGVPVVYNVTDFNSLSSHSFLHSK